MIKTLRPLVLAFWLAVSGAIADPMLARVEAVSRDAVTVTLNSDSGNASRRVTVKIGKGGLPAGVAPGRLVRIWPGPGGDLTAGAGRARLTLVDPGGIHRDRTGVRSRLRRGSAGSMDRGRARGGGRGGR